MAYGDNLPVLNGVTLRRPTSISEGREAIRRDVTLAAGGRRVYSGGTRPTYSLSWGKLLESEVTAIVAAAAPPFVSYRHVDGRTLVVETSPPTVEPIPGTVPVRFAVSLELAAQEPDR